MSEYILVARRPIQNGTVIRGVKEALYIPSGMQGQGGAYNRAELGQFYNRAAGYLQVEPAYERPVYGLGAMSDNEKAATDALLKRLIRKGMSNERARAMIARAVARKNARDIIVSPRRLHPGRGHAYGLRRRVGLGEGDDELLREIISYSQDTQARHKVLIEKLSGAKTWEEQRAIADDLNGLQSEYIWWGLKKVGVSAPAYLDRTNPAHAVLIAVRDDIRDTVALIEAKRVQAALAKEIKEIRESAVHRTAQAIERIDLPKIPGISLWPLAAAAAALVGAKAVGVI
ncbi:MAG: hypothetical protein ACREDF_11095 [Thermoplasmata archaeon]